MPVVLREIHRFPNSGLLYNWDFRQHGNMPITGAPVPTQYRESDARWGSAIESEGVRTAVASGTNVKVDGIIKTTGDTSLGSPNQTSTDTRNRVTRIGYLGQVIMDLLGGGAFQAPKHGNWTSSTNVRFQFVEGGVGHLCAPGK